MYSFHVVKQNMVAKQLEVEKLLADKGWCVIDYGTSDSELIALSKGLGDIILDNNNVIHLLKPKEKSNGIKDSFSYKYGLSQFPYHTDTAFWPIPARYFVLASEQKSGCDTYIVDFMELLNSASEVEIRAIQKSVFSLKTASGLRFSSMLANDNSRIVLRYDPNIMWPYNKYSKEAIEIVNNFLNRSNRIEIKRTGNNIVIIDNWRILHSRSECNEINRVLKRIYIK